MQRKLVVLDLYGTIVRQDGEIVDENERTIFRNGFARFMDKYIHHTFVIASDKDGENKKERDEAEDILRELGLSNGRIAGAYYNSDMVYVPGVTIPGTNGKIKNLKRIAIDNMFDLRDVVSIGDSDVDEASARFSNVPFFRVPIFKDKDEKFDYNYIWLGNTLPLYTDLRFLNEQDN